MKNHWLLTIKAKFSRILDNFHNKVIAIKKIKLWVESCIILPFLYRFVTQYTIPIIFNQSTVKSKI